MRATILILAALLGGCDLMPSPAPEIDALPAASDPEVANLPEFRPETAVACNAVPMRVELTAGGGMRVNGQSSDPVGMRAAAQRKDDACRNAPAMVFFNAPAGVPAVTREETLTALSEIIVNIAVIETSN